MESLTKYLLLASLIVSVQLISLAGTVGIIEGKAFDKATREPIPGVNILLVGTTSGASSDREGRFQIGNVPGGMYDLTATLIGYRTIRLRGVRVIADLRSRVEFAMEESPVQIGEVDIIAPSPPILKDVTGTVHTISNKEIEALPVSSFLDVVALQPGVTSDLHFRGGKSSESLYLVDGLPIQDVIGGGVGTDLPRSSIVSLKVETGGYEAEYGNALSGIVNIITNNGSNENEFTVRGEKDDILTGEQTDHTSEGEVSAGGPIIQDKLFYFGSGSFTLSDTRYWQDLSRFFSSPVTKQFTGFAKLTYQWSPAIKMSAQILGSSRDWRDYEFNWRFNLTGLPPELRHAYRAAFMFSHTVSPKFFYSASISQYSNRTHVGPADKSQVDTTMYQYDFFLRYVIGGNRSWWAESRQTINTLKADFTYQFSEHHLLKAGGEFNLYSVYSDILKYEPQTNIWGKPFLNKPLFNYSSDYSYYPASGSAYLQDKVELTEEGMLLNFGIRYDMLNPRAERPAAERVPISPDEYQTTITGYVPASIKQLISPRVGFSAPFAERGYLFINYGHYVQFPLFDYLYSGLNNVSLQKGVGALVGNPDLQPEKTKAWEFSAKYAFKNDIVLSVTYFDKTTYNQVDVKTFIPSTARAAGNFGFAEFVNNPFAKAQGVEFLIAREKHEWLTGSISYTFMTAEGLSQDARQGLTYYEWGFAPPPKLFPLSWDQRHSLKVIVNAKLPWEADLAVLWTFSTGRPYTFYPTLDGYTPLDSTLKFVPNNARMPDVSNLEIKASKRIHVTDELLLICFLDMRNVFDRRNVLWMDSSGRIGGELGDISAWDTPRRARLGLRMEF
jgi:outer membrane receptor for ferrienterochelin and colicin